MERRVTGGRTTVGRHGTRGGAGCSCSDSCASAWWSLPGSSCSGTERRTRARTATCDATRVTLSADPRIAPVVEEATADLGPWLGPDDCFALDVVSQASATTAAEIARPEGVGLSAPLPDLWLPDSSVWLRQASASEVGAQRLGGESDSVATSPVVLTVSRGEASGWPARQPTWKSLLAEPEGRRALASTDIDVDAAGLLSLWALTGSSTRRLLGVTSRLAVPLLGDDSGAQLVASGEVDAIPSSEQDVIAANRNAADADRVVAVYDPRIRSSLDYPLTTVTDEDADRAAVVSRAAEVVRTALLDPATQDLMAGAGLRTPDGVLAGPYGERHGVVPDAEPGDRLPSVEAVRALSAAWATVGRRSRCGPGRLVRVDGRGRSPGAPIRGPISRRSRCSQAIGSFAPDSDVGLWSFTTGLPDGDWEVLVPTGPMASSVGGTTRRETLLSAVDGLDPKIGGGTPLYDAVQAGYRAGPGRLRLRPAQRPHRHHRRAQRGRAERLPRAAARRPAAPVRRRSPGAHHRDRLRGAGRHREPAPDHRHHRWPHLRGPDRGRGRVGLRPGAGGPVGGRGGTPGRPGVADVGGLPRHANVLERHLTSCQLRDPRLLAS